MDSLLSASVTFKLVLAYDGGEYHGWQRQQGVRTIQGELESALLRVARQQAVVQGCGRTDKGVHALGQVASVKVSGCWTAASLRRALNAVLPPDVRVQQAAQMPDDFHALDDCQGKRYRYQLDDGEVGDLFSRRYRWKIWGRLNEWSMGQGAQHLIGTHDFASFQTSGSPRLSTVRTVRDVFVRRGRGGDPNLVDVEIEADGFLYQMVRGIVGTLYEVGRGARKPDWVREVLQAKDRRQAGQNAPPDGLFLLEAYYPAFPSEQSAPREGMAP